MTAPLPNAFNALLRQRPWILACLLLPALSGPALAEALALPAKALQAAHDLAADTRVLRQGKP